MSAEVQHSASIAAQRAIADLGRTEDVQFLSSDRRLAVAAFHHNTGAGLVALGVSRKVRA